jgi:hypothetical protein
MAMIEGSSPSIKVALTKNRAEQLGMDVWEDFVIPPYYRKNDFDSDMPARIDGGRGSGKTMLLRYLSYQSQFSPKRKVVPLGSTSRPGLYWKADTQFLRMMQKRGRDDEFWADLFSGYLNLRLAFEIISCVFYITKSNFDTGDTLGEESIVIDLKWIKDFELGSNTVLELYDELKSSLRRFELAVHNFNKVEDIFILPSSFLTELCLAVRSGIHWMSDSVFRVYIDEYENLLGYQQRVINTLIKHSEPPIVYNIAVKKNGMADKGTLGDEHIENKADYQVIDIDNQLTLRDFEGYAAEILLKRFSETDMDIDFPFDVQKLTSFDGLAERASKEYGRAIREWVNSVLPRRSMDDLASEVFDNHGYKNKLESEVESALRERGSDLPFKCYMSDNHKKASIVNSILLWRKKLEPSDILDEFNNHILDKPSKYDEKTEWIDNYFVGAYLRLVNRNKMKTTFYSGFDVYVLLSRKNLRHFLELCRTAFSLVEEAALKESPKIDNFTQCLAARETAEELYREIPTFTPRGIQLQKLVYALGQTFKSVQERKAQSEPEISHFCIIENAADHLDIDARMLLSEAEKWGVLHKERSTKSKGSVQDGDFEYILNPVYSPFFDISYRKGRRLNVKVSDFKDLMLGQLLEFDNEMVDSKKPSPYQGELQW